MLPLGQRAEWVWGPWLLQQVRSPAQGHPAQLVLGEARAAGNSARSLQQPSFLPASCGREAEVNRLTSETLT
jgi:hypothetical protein